MRKYLIVALIAGVWALLALLATGQADGGADIALPGDLKSRFFAPGSRILNLLDSPLHSGDCIWRIALVSWAVYTAVGCLTVFAVNRLHRTHRLRAATRGEQDELDTARKKAARARKTSPRKGKRVTRPGPGRAGNRRQRR